MEVRESTAKYMKSPERVATDIGVLPSDWHATELGKVSSCLIGLTYSPSDVSEHGVLVLRSSNIQGGRLEFDDCVYVDMDMPLRVITREGDVLVCVRNGSRELIGKSALIDAQTAGSAFGAFMAVLRSADSGYLRHVLDSAAFKRQTEQRMGATINQITNRHMAAYLVPWPPTRGERQGICEALSDADALIESLSLLLAKKRQIKQGAMQELLTGKKRLPGFRAKWVTRRLDELADIRGGGTPSTAQEQFWNGDVLWCTPTDITALDGKKYLSDTARKLTPLGVRASAAELIPAHSIVMTSRATIGECAINASPVTTNQGLKSFVPVDAVDADFLYYLLQTQRAGFINLCSGSTFLEIGKAQLSAYEVTVPAQTDEQVAVARVLSEMDESIAVLQTKLGKAKEVKQGMVQVLLTGRIRLVQPASNVIPLLPKPATANPPSSQPAHNWQINEAVVIGVLAQRFGSEQFPLPRKRRVKLMYLLHRHAEGRAEGYLKRAAGPYDPNTKYKGPEQIALKNGYVCALHNGTYEGFVAADKIEQAQRYFEQWYGADALEWLERFHYRKTEELELLATVDMAMVDLAAAGEPAGVAGVKRVIAAHPEWAPKLSRELFSDEHIERAMAECAALFPA